LLQKNLFFGRKLLDLLPEFVGQCRFQRLRSCQVKRAMPRRPEWRETPPAKLLLYLSREKAHAGPSSNARGCLKSSSAEAERAVHARFQSHRATPSS
jgi:hypothetical protein